MSDAITVLGYHGTSDTSAQIILESGRRSADRFLISENDSDWLGDGAYFFQDAPYRAREWPKIRLPPPKRTLNPVVICAELQLTDCLDLIDIGAAERIARWYPQMKADYRMRRIRLPRNKGGRRHLDRALINYAIVEMEKNGERVSAVRAAFKEGRPIIPGSQLYSHAHVQIVVRPYRTEVIKGAWLHTFEGEDT